MNDYSKITALYSRLSVGDEDRDGGESNSIQNQDKICQGYSHRSKYNFFESELQNQMEQQTAGHETTMSCSLFDAEKLLKISYSLDFF